MESSNGLIERIFSWLFLMWDHADAESRFLFALVISFQCIVFVVGWWARSQAKQEEENMIVRQGRFGRSFLKLTIPAGELLLVLGVAGTFLGLMLSLPAAGELSDLVAKASLDTLSDADIDACIRQTGIVMDVDAGRTDVQKIALCTSHYIKLATSNAAFAFLTTLIGIAAAILARLFWPNHMIGQYRVGDLLTEIEKVSAKAGTRIEGEMHNFMYKRTLVRLFKELSSRPTCSTYDYHRAMYLCCKNLESVFKNEFGRTWEALINDELENFTEERKRRLGELRKAIGSIVADRHCTVKFSDLVNLEVLR